MILLPFFACSEDITLKQIAFATTYQEGNTVHEVLISYSEGLILNLGDQKECQHAT